MPRRLRDRVIGRQLGFLAALPFIVLGSAFALYRFAGGWSAVAAGIATAFLLFALIEAASRLFLHRAIAEEVQEDVFRQIGLASSIRDAGIDEVRPFGEIDWPAFFRTQQGDTFIAGLTLSSWSMDYAEVVVEEARGKSVHLMLAHADSRERPNRAGRSTYDVGGHATRTVEHFQGLVDQMGLGDRFVVSRIRNEFPFSFYEKGWPDVARSVSTQSGHLPDRTGACAALPRQQP